MPLIFWAPAPLKFTVLIADEVTFKVPAVIVSTLAIPRVELADSTNDVPLMVVLKRLAVPLNVEVPVKVAVPADADRLPLTVRADATEKLASVVTEPVTDSVAKPLVPAPTMVLETPLMVMVPALALRLPLTDKLLARLKDVAVLTEPVTIRLSNEIPEPLMVVPEPVINNVPPDAWLKEPDPVVARLPVKEMVLLERLTADAATVRLLKVWVPDPLTAAPAPVKVTVPVFPLKVPLLTQLPPMLCE